MAIKIIIMPIAPKTKGGSRRGRTTNYGLNKYRELAHKNGVEVPLMDEIYHWEQELMKALSSNDQ